MCFSATASFTLGTSLLATGITLICYTKTKKALLLAFIPLFFGIQQISEGILWLNAPYQEGSVIPIVFKNIFLFFAYIFWPIWFPLSLLFLEKIFIKKIILSICLGIGLSVSAILGSMIPFLKSVPYCSSLQYTLNNSILFPENSPLIFALTYIILIFYGIATLIPLFISSLKKMKILGVLGTVSALIILWIDRTFFVSMWCFFAAIMSLALIFVLKKNRYLSL